MNKPLVSIIIPVYKVESYLNQCIDSVINQTYTNIEIILVDDGSPDRCPEICDEYAKNDSRVRVIHKENGGNSDARNVGIKNSHGEYLLFVDSDDWIEKSTCEQVVSIALQESADLVFFSYIREFRAKSKPKHLFCSDNIIFDTNAVKEKLLRRVFGLLGKELSHPEQADSIVTPWGKLYKSELIKNKVEFVDHKEIGSEDTVFNMHVLKNVKQAVYIDQCLYHYRKYNCNSFTTVYRTELFDRWIRMFSIMRQEIKDNNYPNIFTEALNNRIALSIVGLGLTEVSSSRSFSQKLEKINSILSESYYKKAYKSLKLKCFPLHWKILLYFCKIHFSIGVLLLMYIIKNRIGK